MLLLLALVAVFLYVRYRRRRKGKATVVPIDTGYRGAYRVPGGFKARRTL